MVNTKRKSILALLLTVYLIILSFATNVPLRWTLLAQSNVSATPIRVVIPTSTLPSTEISIATSTPTATSTEEGPIMMEVRVGVEGANIRSEPDPEADQVGTIAEGESYRVLGRYFRWIQFETDNSPTGRAWVFDELVQIIGDESEIPNIDPFSAPTDVPQVAAATLTWAAITQTPGSVLTATAQSRIISAPTSGSGDPEINSSAQTSASLPTFTPPANLVLQVPTEVDGFLPTSTPEPDALSNALDIAQSTEIPPIVFIAGLGGLGILGILMAVLRS